MTEHDRYHSSTTRWLLAFGRPVLWPLAISVVCRVAQLATGAALLGYAAYAVMNAVISGSGSALRALTIIAVLAAVKGLFHYLEHYAGHWVAFRTLAMMRVFFYERLAALAPAVTYRHRTGDLLGRVTRDIDRLEVFFAHTVVPAIAAVVMPAGLLVIFTAAGYPLTAGVLVPFFVLLGGGLSFVGRRRSRRAEAETVRIGGDLSAHLADTIDGLREVTAYGAERMRHSEQSHMDDDAAAHHRIVARWAAFRASGVRLTQAGALGAVVVTGHLTTASPTAVAVLAAATVATFPALSGVDGFAALLGSTRTAVQRVRAIAEEIPATPDSTSDDAPPPGAPEIQLVDVDFAHPGTDRSGSVLSRLDLTIPAGSTVGLLGRTGSGKSTIGALIARVWDPTHGRILWNGTDLRHIPLAEMRRRVTVVDQDPFLFRDSLAANLRLGAPHATDRDLWQALDLVSLADLVRSLPDGLSTTIGEQGGELSGGQRQRLAVARALLHDGELIVVDEATSQLDAATEALVLDRIQQAWSDRTVVWITHRPDTLRLCDHVYHLEHGRLTALGTP